MLNKGIEVIQKIVLKFLIAFLFAVSSPLATAGAGVASAHPMATVAGIKILEMGGNVFDAAIAVTSTLAMVDSAGSGIGGGGFWLLHDVARNNSVMLDG